MKFNKLSFNRRKWNPREKRSDPGQAKHYVQASQRNSNPDEVAGFSGLYRTWESELDADGNYVHKPNGRTAGKDKWYGTCPIGPKEPWKDFLKSRQIAAQYAELEEQGIDIGEYKRKQRIGKSAENKTFDAGMAEYIEAHQAEWRSPKHLEAWQHSRRAVAPEFGKMALDAITSRDIRHAISPMWRATPVTARRTLDRVAAVINWFVAREELPATSTVNAKLIATGLGSQGKREEIHLAALEYAKVPALAQLLRASNAVADKALLFTVLTAARSGEVLGARWNEITGDTWVIPPERMKGFREHEVPLSPAAIDVLNRMRKLKRKPDSLIFPGRFPGSHISGQSMTAALRRATSRKDITTHGMRSAFASWCTDKTDFPWEIREASLAHKVPEAVIRSYVRTTMIDKRRDLMCQWGDHCLHAAEVIEFKRA